MNVFSTVLAQHLHHHDMMRGGGWRLLWGTLIMILVLAVIALVVFLVVRSVLLGRPSGGAQSAHDIL
jgi:uncharacterized membrane protein